MNNVGEIDECVRAYLKSLSKFKSLTKEEEHKLIRKYQKEGDLRARDKVIESNLKYTCKIASSYRGRGILFSDLISEANDALIKAIDKFDLRQDVKLLSYAKWDIIQRMMSCIANKNKMPLSELTDDNDTSGIGLNDDNEVCVSFSGSDKNDAMANEMDDDYEEESQNKFLEKITEDLNKRETDMINMYYGIHYHKEHTLDEIGKKYNLTKERVRQIIETGFKKIRSKSILVDSEYLSR